jgi:CpeT/CpcT family (DUF1001)
MQMVIFMKTGRFLLLLVIGSAILGACSKAIAPSVPPPVQTKPLSPTLTEDMQTMLGWFEGEFDNFQQVWKEKEDSVAKDLIHEHIHSIFKKVNMPQLGQQVFFVKQYMDGDESKIYRQRIYSFFPNNAENAIQLDIFAFADANAEKKYANANVTPAILLDLPAAELKKTDGCEVFWKKQQDHFIGYMKDKACNMVSRRSGKRIFIMDSLKLTPNQIWIRDEATDENGGYVFGHKGHVHHKLIRCRNYKGWIVVRKDGEKEEYYVRRDITLHDQGQRAQLITAAGEKTKYWVELAQVVYKSGLPVLKLAIYEEGVSRAIVYTWANPEAKILGINTRALQAGFTLAE